jgi:hypothetical protein
MQGHDMRKGTSSFIPGYRSNIEYLHKYLTGSVRVEKFKKKMDLTLHIFEQLTSSYTLFHRFNYFCDIIGVADGYYEYIHEIPLSSVKSYANKKWKTYFTVKFAYHLDLKRYNSWNFPKVSKWAHSDKSLVIHPILTTMDGYEMHIPEDPWNEWSEISIKNGVNSYLIDMLLKYCNDEVSPDEINAWKLEMDLKYH